MFPEFEVCNTTRSTITEVPLSRYSGSPLDDYDKITEPCTNSTLFSKISATMRCYTEKI